MIQEIITYMILLATMLVTINMLVGVFKNTSGACNGCASHDSGCKIAELKKRSRVSG